MSAEKEFLHFKIVEYLDADCCISDKNEPTTILTLAHNGEAEIPLMLSVEDTQKIIVGLLSALDKHGNVTASNILDTFLKDGYRNF